MSLCGCHLRHHPLNLVLPVLLSEADHKAEQDDALMTLMMLFKKVLTTSSMNLAPGHGIGALRLAQPMFPFLHPFTRRCMPFDMRKVIEENMRLTFGQRRNSNLLWFTRKRDAYGNVVGGEYLNINVGRWVEGDDGRVMEREDEVWVRNDRDEPTPERDVPPTPVRGDGAVPGPSSLAVAAAAAAAAEAAPEAAAGRGLDMNGLIVRAHRIICWARNGPPPPGMGLACHTCNNKMCLNPLHLRWGNSLQG